MQRSGLGEENKWAADGAGGVWPRVRAQGRFDGSNREGVEATSLGTHIRRHTPHFGANGKANGKKCKGNVRFA